MSDPLNPQTLDDTTLLEGTIASVAVSSIGSPEVILWLTSSGSVTREMHGSLGTDAVSRLGMLQLLQHAVVDKREVEVRYTVDTQGLKWFHFVRML